MTPSALGRFCYGRSSTMWIICIGYGNLELPMSPDNEIYVCVVILQDWLPNPKAVGWPMHTRTPCSLPPAPGGDVVMRKYE